MSDPFDAITTLDRVVHEPARLAILSALEGCRRAEFLFLQSLIGVSKGNLWQHVSKLHDAGLVGVEKTFKGRTPCTVVHLTPDGRTAIRAYWRGLAQARRQMTRWGLHVRQAASQHT